MNQGENTEHARSLKDNYQLFTITGKLPGDLIGSGCNFRSTNPSYTQIRTRTAMTVDEFNRCVDLYADSLYRFILKNVKDKDKAKDIVQDTYEKLWLKVSETEAKNAKSYMFTTAYRTMIDYLRKDQRQGTMEEAPMIAVSHNKQYSDLKEILNEALSKLPEIQRSVVMLRDYEGYSYAEIAQITNLNESQVKVYIFRARTFLKNYIGSIEKVV